MIYAGVDLLSLKRIAEILETNGASFIARVCTPYEKAKLDTFIDFKKVNRVASHFALKEAFSKALGEGIGAELSFQDVEISYSAKGQPQIAYIGKNKKFGNLHALCLEGGVSCSISHEGDFLTALVVISGSLR